MSLDNNLQLEFTKRGWLKKSCADLIFDKGLKWCPGCRQVKRCSEYNLCTRNLRGVQTYCVACRCRMRTAERDKWLQFFDRVAPPVCFHCGYNSCFEAMDLHHLDPHTKELIIANFVHEKSCTAVNQQILLEEMKKCVWLCTRCHRELHANFFTTTGIDLNRSKGD